MFTSFATIFVAFSFDQHQTFEAEKLEPARQSRNGGSVMESVVHSVGKQVGIKLSVKYISRGIR